MIQEKIICTNTVKDGFHNQGLYKVSKIFWE